MTSVAWIFLSFDITCLLIQSAGGAIASTKNVQQARLGSRVALVGIVLQTSKHVLASARTHFSYFGLSCDLHLHSRSRGVYLSS